MYLSFHIFEISTGSTNVSTDSGRKGYLIDVACSLLTVLLGFANTLNRRKEAKRNVTGILLGLRTGFHKLDYGTWDLGTGPISLLFNVHTPYLSLLDMAAL